MNKNYLILPLLLIMPLCNSEPRDYENTEISSVEKTYLLNHKNQTLAFVLQKERCYIGQKHKVATMWEVAKEMTTFIDESDPDTTRPQIVHALQVGEAMRKDGLPREWILAGFIHDFGKILYSFGEPQWAVVGDTFPVGCAFSKRIVYSEFFSENPDFLNPSFNDVYGIYKPNCGLDNVHMSWGHDEYLYNIVKEHLPDEISYAIRYHSFYPHHQEHAYDHLLNKRDHDMLQWIELLNSYDLYTKQDAEIDIKSLLPYYKELVEEFFPHQLRW